MKITVTISDDNAKVINEFLATARETVRKESCTHGPLDMPKLAAMLLDDVAEMIRRPGSWEGANMAQVMASHGYEL